MIIAGSWLVGCFVGLLVGFTEDQHFSGHLTPNWVILIKVPNNSVKYKYNFLFTLS